MLGPESAVPGFYQGAQFDGIIPWETVGKLWPVEHSHCSASQSCLCLLTSAFLTSSVKEIPLNCPRQRCHMVGSWASLPYQFQLFYFYECSELFCILPYNGLLFPLLLLWSVIKARLLRNSKSTWMSSTCPSYNVESQFMVSNLKPMNSLLWSLTYCVTGPPVASPPLLKTSFHLGPQILTNTC